MFAPKGTPRPILDKLTDALDKASDDEKVRNRLVDIGGDIPSKEQRGASARHLGGKRNCLLKVNHRGRERGASVLTHSFDTRRRSFFQRAPAPCILLQDDIGFGGPLEGLRFGVALGEPDLDGSLEIGDALEHTAADCLARDFGEQPFDEVDPGR